MEIDVKAYFAWCKTQFCACGEKAVIAAGWWATEKQCAECMLKPVEED